MEDATLTGRIHGRKKTSSKQSNELDQARRCLT